MRAALLYGPEDLRVENIPAPEGEILVAVPRLCRAHVRSGLRVEYGNERIAAGRPNAVYRNLLDGRTVTAGDDGTITASSAFPVAPLAILLPD